jgi:UDP-N-acetylglucosamine kinase
LAASASLDSKFLVKVECVGAQRDTPHGDESAGAVIRNLMPPQDYFLSEEENKRIFDEQIRPHEFGSLEQYGHRDGTQPICVLIAGQTGAGKTRTAPQVVETLEAMNRRFVHLIADTYKTYHPAYPSLIQTKPGLASPATGHDARKWLALACEHAMALRLDSVVESACRNPSDFTSLADAFHAAGFAVFVVVLAVHEAQSRLGILVRYFHDLPEARSRNLPLRLTPRNVHDESYDGLMKVAEFIDATPSVDRVAVVRRGNLVGHENRRTAGGQWSSSPNTAGALGFERQRPGVTDEVRAFEADMKAIRNDHPEKEDEFAEIERMFQDVQRTDPVAKASSDLLLLDCHSFLTL